MNYETKEEIERWRQLVRGLFDKRPDLHETFRGMLVTPVEPEVRKIKDALEQDAH